jgi:hypothetical protein
VSRSQDGFLPLSPRLDGEALRFWTDANQHVLWGWKRDVGAQRRMVYCSARLARRNGGVGVCDPFFVYQHRTTHAAAERFHDALAALARRPPAFLGTVALTSRNDRRSGLRVVRLQAGAPSAADRDRVRRLGLRRPRSSIGEPVLPEESRHEALPDLFPVDLYLGSGVSYEAGLPTLCDIHDAFRLDDHERENFTVGERDRLPQLLADDPWGTFAEFCRLHVLALSAQPTRAQRIVADLYRRGLVRSVLTDNVDNLLCKTGVPFTRTRGSGVFNERFPVKFRTRTLIVVGVAADRREIVRQARGRRLRIVVVNPCTRVSPRVQHLNYIRPDDLFFRETADSFFSYLKGALEGWADVRP